MSTGSIKTITILFFILVVVGMGLSISVIRMKHIETTDQAFQGIIPDSDQFAQTFGTMDLGLREKTSQKILAAAERIDGLHFLVIQDQRNATALLWQAPDTSQSPPTNGAIPYVPLIPSSDMWAQVNETSLSGSFRLIIWTDILSYDDVVRVGILGLAILAAFAVFLIIEIMVGTGSKTKNAATENEPEAAEPAVAVFEESASPSSELVQKHPIQVSVEEEPKEEKDSKFVVLDRQSGVSHERFLPFRLDKELERSAENVVDLSLALFKFQNIDSDKHAQAAAMVLSEFSHEDLIFEFGTDSFCVILPQHDLDQAIARAELLIRKADGKFVQQTSEVVLTAGLSSRNGRLLDSKRFLKEAITALRKANTREGRIVGFRPDPVRFRNFLRHQRV